MPSITLKNIPELLYRRLAEIARSHHRSLSQELVVALETYARTPDADKQIQLERIRASRGRYRAVITDSKIKDWKESGRP